MHAHSPSAVRPLGPASPVRSGGAGGLRPCSSSSSSCLELAWERCHAGTTLPQPAWVQGTCVSARSCNIAQLMVRTDEISPVTPNAADTTGERDPAVLLQTSGENECDAPMCIVISELPLRSGQGNVPWEAAGPAVVACCCSEEK